jgi:membrane glycosyltransferase
LYALAGILAYSSLGLWSIVLTLPYLIMISKTYRVRHSLEEIFKLYKVFPTINMTIGFLLFLLTVSKIFLN